MNNFKELELIQLHSLIILKEKVENISINNGFIFHSGYGILFYLERHGDKPIFNQTSNFYTIFTYSIKTLPRYIILSYNSCIKF